jgi:hypothetical protein
MPKINVTKPQQTQQKHQSPAKLPTQQQLNHHADTLNVNRGTSGTNITNAQVHGNRGALLNPNRKP